MTEVQKKRMAAVAAYLKDSVKHNSCTLEHGITPKSTLKWSLFMVQNQAKIYEEHNIDGLIIIVPYVSLMFIFFLLEIQFYIFSNMFSRAYSYEFTADYSPRHVENLITLLRFFLFFSENMISSSLCFDFFLFFSENMISSSLCIDFFYFFPKIWSHPHFASFFFYFFPKIWSYPHFASIFFIFFRKYDLILTLLHLVHRLIKPHLVYWPLMLHLVYRPFMLDLVHR